MAKGANFGTAAGVNVSSQKITLRSVYGANANAAARYLQVFDQAAGPNTNDVPVFSFLLGPGLGASFGSNFFGERGVNMLKGLNIGISTARDTYQPATPAECTLNWITG